MNKHVQHINPDGLMKSPAFSQVVTTEGAGKTIYVGGQNAVNHKQEVIGKGDIAAQTTQVMQNVQTALRAAGADFKDVIKFGIHIVQGQNIQEAFKAAQPFMSQVGDPAAVTGVVVAGLTNPEFLIEVEAIAFVPGR